MGADIKTLKTRIKSVNSTLHLTKAMGLVAASKIRRANDEMSISREYEKTVKAILDTAISSDECDGLFLRSGGEHIRLVVISGDRGLAGGYNSNVLRLAAEWKESEIIPIGYRACERYGCEMISSESFGISEAKALAEKLCCDFEAEKYDRLGIICTRYVSMMTQEACIKWILPLKRGKNKNLHSVVFEPSVSDVLNAVVPEYVLGVLISSVRESFACETAARRMAMDSAEKNAGQMINDLQLEYNRVRQWAITQELTEIVAGGEV